MIVLVISTKLAFILIGSLVILLAVIGIFLYDQNKKVRVCGNIIRIDPPQGNDDYTNIVLWNHNGNTMYRVYIHILHSVKNGDHVELFKKKFESIYRIGFIQSEG